MRSGHCKIEYRKRKAAQANFNRNKGLLVSDDLPQRRKSTLEFILLSVIHASEHLLIVFRDLSEEEGKGRKQPYTWGQISNSSGGLFKLHILLSVPFWSFSYTFLGSIFSHTKSHSQVITSIREQQLLMGMYNVSQIFRIFKKADNKLRLNKRAGSYLMQKWNNLYGNQSIYNANKDSMAPHFKKRGCKDDKRVQLPMKELRNNWVAQVAK